MSWEAGTEVPPGCGRPACAVTHPTLPAEHEGPVSSVRLSPDGSRVLSTTTSGHLGFLDVPSREYSVLVRSHTAPVLALATECSRGQLATVSQDHTVRVWDLATLQQVECGRRRPCRGAGGRAQAGGGTLRLRPPGERRALRSSWSACSDRPACPHAAPPSSSTTSRRPRKRRARSPSTPRSPPSSAASAAGLSAPSAWRPPGSWWSTGGCPAGPWLRTCPWWVLVGYAGGRAEQGRAVYRNLLLCCPLGIWSGTVQLGAKAVASLCVGRCHQGAVTGLVTSPDGSLLFSACSQGTLAQYRCAAPCCRVLRVAG